jgi:hypothetical protein
LHDEKNKGGFMRQRTTFMTYLLTSLLVIAIALVIGYERNLQASSTSTAASSSSGTPTQPSATVPGSSFINTTIVVDGETVPLNQACQDHSRPLPRLIVDVTTMSTPLASHWNTPGGLRPANNSIKNVSPSSIVTPLQFSSMHIIVDTRSAKTSEMVTLGGKAGTDQIRVIGSLYPSLQPHQRYLLFFDRGVSEQQLVAVAAFRIVGTDTVVAQEKIVEQGQVTQPEVTMSLSQVITQLQTNCR